MPRDKEYLKEFSDHNAKKVLEDIASTANSMIKLIELGGKIGNPTKNKIIDSYDALMSASSREYTKLIRKQRKAGKEFLSDKEIDEIVDQVLREES